MTHRTLTTIVLRFAALMLFIKIFDSFGAYFYSVVLLGYTALHNQPVLEGIDKFYVNGTLLLFANVIVSSFLFFKAEWIANRLIRSDHAVTANLSAGELIRVILLTTGVLWFVSLIFLLPELFDFIEVMVAKLNGTMIRNKLDFSPVYFLTKLFFAWLFIFRSERIAVYLEKKMARSPDAMAKTEPSDQSPANQ
jgi:hypothetical protein